MAQVVGKTGEKPYRHDEIEKQRLGRIVHLLCRIGESAKPCRLDAKLFNDLPRAGFRSVRLMPISPSSALRIVSLSPSPNLRALLRPTPPQLDQRPVLAIDRIASRRRYVRDSLDRLRVFPGGGAEHIVGACFRVG